MALGHLQSGTVEAVLIFFAAGWIIYEAAHKLLAPQPIEAVGWGVGVMLVSSVMNMIVSHRLSKVCKETTRSPSRPMPGIYAPTSTPRPVS